MPDVSRLRDLWRSLELRGQVTLVASLLAVLVTAGFLFRFAAKPTYATLASGLEPAESADVTHALEGAGIPYHLIGGGTGVSVAEGKLATARVALAKQGLPRGGHVGFELFDKKSLGATDFQQKVDYQRALEGEIARTVEQIEGVQGAEVQLVLPEETLFADEGAKASAAVLLSSSQLDPATVRGIAHLVSSSVKGLEADGVTITDSTGQLLWPDGDSGASGGFSASGKLRAEQAYAGQLTGQLNALLTSTLGAGKAQARVHADLSLDEKSIARVVYGKKGTPLQSQTEEETLGSKGTGGNGPAGVASNVPTYGGVTATSGGKSDYLHKTESKTYGVDKTIEKTTVAPGAVKKLDVAVMVDESVPLDQVDSLRSAVAAAAGIDEKRGDTLSVTTMKFAEPTGTVAGGDGGPLVPFGIPRGLAKDGLIGLGALVFLLVVRRGLKRREEEGIAPEPTWLREIASTVPLAQLEAVPTSRMQIDAIAEERTSLRNEIEQIANTEPEQVAVQVKQWLKE